MSRTAHNSGRLHGVWLDATLDLEDVQSQVNAMLAASPVANAEEYAIHDHEGFGSFSVGEYAGLESAHLAARHAEAKTKVPVQLWRGVSARCVLYYTRQSTRVAQQHLAKGWRAAPCWITPLRNVWPLHHQSG